MMPAPIPKNEKKRMEDVKGLCILDSKPEEFFDCITRLVTQIFDVPVSTLTIIDGKREWFKSAAGLTDKEGPRKVSFCAHAILENKPFVIPDATADKRFATNPYVKSKKDPIRFYAGAQIKGLCGLKVGVLCAIGKEPKKATKKQLKALKDLALLAEYGMKYRVTIDKIDKSVEALKKSKMS